MSTLEASFTHKSFSEKVFNTVSSELTAASSLETNHIKKELSLFDYQRLEYLGDCIVNFCLAKLFYLETSEGAMQWHFNYFLAMKVHDLKTWFSSNQWMAFLLYEHYFFSQSKEERSNSKNVFDQFEKNRTHTSFLHEQMPQAPVLYDVANQAYDKQIKQYQQSLLEVFTKSIVKACKSGLSLSSFSA